MLATHILGSLILGYFCLPNVTKPWQIHQVIDRLRHWGELVHAMYVLSGILGAYRIQNPWPYSVLNPWSMIGFTIRHCLLSNNIGYRFVDCIPIVFSCGLRWLAFWPFSTLQEQVSFPVPGFYLLVAIFCYGWLCYGWSMWITNLSHVATLARMMMNVIMYWWCVMLSCHFYVCIFLCGYLSDTICFF